MSSTLLEKRIGRRRGHLRVNVEDIPEVRIAQPVTVDNDRLEVDSAKLETERVYSFEYLGVKMVLWKLPDGTIDLFQVIEE